MYSGNEETTPRPAKRITQAHRKIQLLSSITSYQTVLRSTCDNTIYITRSEICKNTYNWCVETVMHMHARMHTVKQKLNKTWKIKKKSTQQSPIVPLTQTFQHLNLLTYTSSRLTFLQTGDCARLPLRPTHTHSRPGKAIADENLQCGKHRVASGHTSIFIFIAA